MESQLKCLECPVCLYLLSDPRMLPCGHSFCGPPKQCLKSSSTLSTIKCPLCQKLHKRKLDELCPMYGFNDYLQKLNDSDNLQPPPAKKPRILLEECSEHKEAKNMYCKSCEVPFCIKWSERDSLRVIDGTRIL